MANVIQNLRIIFLSLSISEIVKAGSNTIYKYEYEYTICVLYKTQIALPEKSPNAELFLVRIFQDSDWIRRDTSYLSVFIPNAEKYGPEITPYLDTFHAV